MTCVGACRCVSETREGRVRIRDARHDIEGRREGEKVGGIGGRLENLTAGRSAGTQIREAITNHNAPPLRIFQPKNLSALEYAVIRVFVCVCELERP